MLIGFEDAEVIIGLALIHGGHPLVHTMVVRIFGTAQLGQDVVFDVVARRRNEVGKPARMVGRLMRFLVWQILVHFDDDVVTMK